MTDEPKKRRGRPRKDAINPETGLPGPTPSHPLVPAKQTLAGNPEEASDRMSRRYSKSLSFAIRENVDPRLLQNFWLAIMAGKNPVIVANEDGVFDSVDWNDQELAPTLEHKMAAAKVIQDRGWGLPVQSITLEADIRTQQATMNVNLDAQINELPPTVQLQIMQLLQLNLPGGRSSEPGAGSSTLLPVEKQLEESVSVREPDIKEPGT